MESGCAVITLLLPLSSATAMEIDMAVPLLKNFAGLSVGHVRFELPRHKAICVSRHGPCIAVWLVFWKDCVQCSAVSCTMHIETEATKPLAHMHLETFRGYLVPRSQEPRSGFATIVLQTHMEAEQNRHQCSEIEHSFTRLVQRISFS